MFPEPCPAPGACTTLALGLGSASLFSPRWIHECIQCFQISYPNSFMQHFFPQSPGQANTFPGVELNIWRCAGCLLWAGLGCAAVAGMFPGAFQLLLRAVSGQDDVLEVCRDVQGYQALPVFSFNAPASSWEQSAPCSSVIVLPRIPLCSGSAFRVTSFQEGWAPHPFVCSFLEGLSELLRCIFLLFFPVLCFSPGLLIRSPAGCWGSAVPVLCAAKSSRFPPPGLGSSNCFLVLGSFPPHRPGLRNCSAALVKLLRPPRRCLKRCHHVCLKTH